MRLSIITINLNNCAGLERTLQSVTGQTFGDYEYLVIDGGSSDGSRELLDRYASFIHYWVSEPDGGIYQAMNKGILAARGDYCLFLNSGDWLAGREVLSEVFASPPEADIVAGNVYFFDPESQRVKWQVDSPAFLTARTLFAGTLPHQATLIRRQLFSSLGLYRTDLRIASDWVFFLEALLVHQCSYQHIPCTISYFSMDGISCDPALGGLARQEQLGILRQQYPRFLPDYERLAELEAKQLRWEQSHENTLYTLLRKGGIISLGVGALRAARYLNRLFVKKSV